MTTTIFPEAKLQSAPTNQTLPGTSSDDHLRPESHTPCVVGSSSSSHITVDSHNYHAAGPLVQSAITFADPKSDPLAASYSASQDEVAAQWVDAGGSLSLAAIIHSSPKTETRRGTPLYNPYLCLLADSLDDLEDLRIATDNRVRSLTRSQEDSDGEMRGLGLDARSPEVARAMVLAERIGQLEHQATLDLKRELRRSPFFPWVQRSKGIGEKQAARLLAVIGDPYWNDLHDRPRTVSELWAYCGYAVRNGRADRRQKGVLSNWNDKAKMRAYLMAESCVKSGGDYRAVYDSAREHYADAVHPHECVRCGPKGKPALAGTPLSAGHQHARALRALAKEILKDLWVEARAYHEEVTK